MHPFPLIEQVQGDGREGSVIIRHPVIFIPGLGGSQLYNRQELLWLDPWRVVRSHLPGRGAPTLQWLMPLSLRADGATPHDPAARIRVGDILRQPLADAYGGLVRALGRAGYREGRALWLLPYDWRVHPSAAVVRLGRLVDRVLARTQARQVILMGHSMGGLIAREYVVRGGAGKVRALLALATPWLGAPMAYRALAYGWDMGLKFPVVGRSALPPGDVHTLVRNYPSVYLMAPGREYFALYPEGYLVRDGRPLSYQRCVREALAAHNPHLARQAPAYRPALLDGHHHGVDHFLLVGRGHPTLTRLEETVEADPVEHAGDGDGVVPLHSADLGHEGAPARPAAYLGPVADVAYVGAGHIFFARSAPVQRKVLSWLRQIQAAP